MKKAVMSPNDRIIHIRGGLTTIVDADLFDFLNKYKWFPKKSAHSVYVCTRKIIQGKAHTIRMHRLVLNAPANMKVHHIHHNTFDNRREFLMLVTEREHRHFDGWHYFYR